MFLPINYFSESDTIYLIKDHLLLQSYTMSEYKFCLWYIRGLSKRFLKITIFLNLAQFI
jgi:hypothetical protein